MDEGQRGSRAGELLPHGRQAIEQALPRRLALLESQRAGQGGARRDARAREAVAESQNPDPAAVENVVEGGVVRRVGRRLARGQDVHLVEAARVREVGVEAGRLGQPVERPLPDAERLPEKSPRPRRVHGEPRADLERLSGALAGDADASVSGFDAIERRAVEILGAGVARLADEEEVEVRAIPVRVGDLVARRGGDEELVAAIRVGGEAAGPHGAHRTRSRASARRRPPGARAASGPTCRAGEAAAARSAARAPPAAGSPAATWTRRSRSAGAFRARGARPRGRGAAPRAP